MAAGSIIVQEAGGTVTDLNGTDNFMETAHILAGSESMHKNLKKLIKKSNHAGTKTCRWTLKKEA